MERLRDRKPLHRLHEKEDDRRRAVLADPELRYRLGRTDGRHDHRDPAHHDPVLFPAEIHDRGTCERRRERLSDLNTLKKMIRRCLIGSPEDDNNE